MMRDTMNSTQVYDHIVQMKAQAYDMIQECLFLSNEELKERNYDDLKDAIRCILMLTERHITALKKTNAIH